MHFSPSCAGTTQDAPPGFQPHAERSYQRSDPFGAHLKRDIESLSLRGSLLTAGKSSSSSPFFSLRQVFGSRRAFPVECCQTNRRIAAWNFEPFLKSRRHTKGEVRSGDCSYGAPPHGWLCVQLLAACRDRSSAPRSEGETHHGH